MVSGVLMGLVVLLEPAAAPSVGVHAHREHVLPERNDDLAARAQSWSAEAGYRVSPAVPATSVGARVAAGFSATTHGAVELQARGVGVNAAGACDASVVAGPWTTLETTFRGAEFRVAVIDLEASYGCAQLRVRDEDQDTIGNLQWELLAPRYPDAGRASRSFAGPSDPQKAVAPELEMLGVITREEWGARATQCSATEDDWHRMAIHHTAGPQTANDSVIERLQGTQAYGMDSGGFCDIPYQMLVGFDGTLYEGRDLGLMSGATGGGNNPGNLAVCFIGCYHEPDSDCVGGQGHDPTEAMMERGQLLVQTLVRLHEISTADDNIRGHRDWPGNSTACPGSLLHPLLGELRADLTWFAGGLGDRSWEGDELEVTVGQDVEVWVELENTGGLAWEPEVTFLAPTAPRDTDSVLAHASWPSATRAATVDAVVEPGDIGRFTFTVSMDSDDVVTQTFGLVHESVTWFADEPWGGGPTDDAITITVRGVGGSAETGAGSSTTDGGNPTAEGSSSGGGGEGEAGGTDAVGETTTGDEPGTGTGGGSAALPQPSSDSGGCGCHSGPSHPGWAGVLLLGLLGLRRRRER